MKNPSQLALKIMADPYGRPTFIRVCPGVKEERYVITLLRIRRTNSRPQLVFKTGMNAPTWNEMQAGDVL